jgi:hypothetical protein
MVAFSLRSDSVNRPLHRVIFEGGYSGSWILSTFDDVAECMIQTNGVDYPSDRRATDEANSAMRVPSETIATHKVNCNGRLQKQFQCHFETRIPNSLLV